MSITVAGMKDKLTSVDSIRERLGATEPLSSQSFSVGSDVWFTIDPNWNISIDELADEDLVSASVAVEGSEFQLTKAALLEASSVCGLTKGYASRTPAQFIAPQLNYWFRGGLPNNDYKLMSANGTALALTRQTVQPFSNLRLLDQAVDGIKAKYGDDGEILVDKKFAHSLRTTHLRLVVPEQSRVIERTGTEDDTWSLGVQVKNSLIGAEQTSIDGYLFRWWCSNGAIETNASSGVFSRRGGQGQGDEVYAWARSSVDEILGGLEHSFDTVQELVDIPVEGEAVDVLRDVFEQYKIPGPQRDAIIAEMVEARDLTMYSVMNAITSVANDTELSPAHAERLMRVGGDLVHSAHDRCNSCRRLLPN